MGRRLIGCLAWITLTLVLPAADTGKDLLDAAAQGRTASVQDLLGKGAPLESKDKNGRTALMLAAQRGHAAIVRLLLENGANAAARDQNGATAWVLAMFATAGARGASEEVLKLLPQPPRPKLAVEAGWSTANLYSSCTMRLDQLTMHMNRLQPDLLALAEFRNFFETSGRSLVEIAGASGRGVAPVPDDEAFAGADAVLVLVVRPAASCVPQRSSDNLSLAIEIQLLRANDRAVLLRKTLGGGLTGLHARTVANQTQYLPVYEELVKSHIEQIYWAVVEAWYRAG
jgi:Ankyrin repeats (3 copies)